MIDHILVYPNAAARDAAWPGPLDMDGNSTNAPAWTDAFGRCVMPVRAVLARATYDAEGEVVSPEVTADGAWVTVRTMRRDHQIEATAETVLALDAGTCGVLKCTLAADSVIPVIEPCWAGAGYQLPAGELAITLDAWRIA